MTNDRFTVEEAAYYQAKCEYLLSGKERFIEKVNNDEMEGLYGDLEEDCSDIEGEGLRCRAGKCCFWITWNGRMLPCGMFANDAPYMNIFENDFDDCWNTVTETIRRIRLPAKCAGCKIKDKCKACAAMVYTETGTFDQVPVYRCDMAHAYHAQCEKLVEEINQE